MRAVQKRWGPTLVVSALLVIVPMRAAAQQDQSSKGATEYYLETMEKGGVEAEVISMSLASYVQAYTWANEMNKHRGHPPLYCPPKKLAITGDQAADIIKRHVEKNPKDASFPIGFAMLRAFQETFPC